MTLPRFVRTRRAFIVAVLLLGGSALVAVRALGDGRAGAELSLSRWNRVSERLVQQARALRHAAPDTTVAAPPPPEAPSSVGPPRERTRVPGPPLDSATLLRQAEDYAADRPKSVTELQLLRRTQEIPIRSRSGATGTATLVNLSPTVNAWYLLTVRWDGKDGPSNYHLVNGDPAHADLVLDSVHASGPLIRDSEGDVPCDLWSDGEEGAIAQAAGVDDPYVPLCGDRVSLRRRTAGHKTSIEKVTDFLRNHVWGGEAITVFVRETFFVDAWLDTARVLADSAEVPELARAPTGASLDPAKEGSSLAPSELGIAVEGAVDGKLAAGRWYAAEGLPGIFVSVLRPDLISRELLTSHPGVVAALDEVERQALAYLVAFDLANFEVAFALGTDHPRVVWSDRPPESVRSTSLPGPDGIGTIDPLVATGIVGPAVVDRVAATFTGGFKRSHGAFKNGPLSLANRGSHYGFIENGVILSKLQPGLATLYVTDDGHVDMTTWTGEDNAHLADLRFARQNGVPLVEPDTLTGLPAPGSLVSRWALGNWSGSAEGTVRTLRAGACIQEQDAARFLLYGYFSTATPAAMARVFQAYGCRYAMLLDMNALEHTYAAVYRAQGSNLRVEHLIQGMSVLDKTVDGVLLPRFLGFADNRDFFYLLWKTQPEDEP